MPGGVADDQQLVRIAPWNSSQSKPRAAHRSHPGIGPESTAHFGVMPRNFVVQTVQVRRSAATAGNDVATEIQIATRFAEQGAVTRQELAWVIHYAIRVESRA